MPVPTANYNALIPQPSDDLSFSQPQILANFGAIQSLVDVNHYDFTGGINATAFANNAGKHFFVEMPVVSTIPDTGVPVTEAAEVGLYCQMSTVTMQPELVFSHQFGSTAPVGAKIVEFTSALWGSPGWARFPSGILMKWGRSANLMGNITLVMDTVPASIPVFSVAPYAVFYTIFRSNAPSAVAYFVPGTTTNVALGINIINAANGTATVAQVQWLAIGLGS